MASLSDNENVNKLIAHLTKAQIKTYSKNKGAYQKNKNT